MSSSSRPRMTGIGRVLVIVYAIMALAAWMQCNSQDRTMLELMGHLP